MSGGLRRELGLASLLAVVFFNVSGGPYGIEDAVASFGPGLALLLLVVTPLVWSLPVSLAMAEMAGALPDEGGYVTWVRRAFGPFWGFQVGWWSWLNSFVDVAGYPALFADYLRFWWPGMSAPARWALALGFIWSLTGLNVAGVRLTGRSAVVLGVCALVPVAILTAMAAGRAQHVPWLPAAVSLLAMATAGWLNTAIGVAAALTGPAAYAWWGRAWRSPGRGRL